MHKHGEIVITSNTCKYWCAKHSVSKRNIQYIHSIVHNFNVRAQAIKSHLTKAICVAFCITAACKMQAFTGNLLFTETLCSVVQKITNHLKPCKSIATYVSLLMFTNGGGYSITCRQWLKNIQSYMSQKFHFSHVYSNFLTLNGIFLMQESHNVDLHGANRPFHLNK